MMSFTERSGVVDSTPLMCIQKRVGPSADPWGLPLHLTNCFLLVR